MLGCVFAIVPSVLPDVGDRGALDGLGFGVALEIGGSPNILVAGPGGSLDESPALAGWEGETEL